MCVSPIFSTSPVQAATLRKTAEKLLLNQLKKQTLEAAKQQLQSQGQGQGQPPAQPQPEPEPQQAAQQQAAQQATQALGAGPSGGLRSSGEGAGAGPSSQRHDGAGPSGHAAGGSGRADRAGPSGHAGRSSARADGAGPSGHAGGGSSRADGAGPSGLRSEEGGTGGSAGGAAGYGYGRGYGSDSDDSDWVRGRGGGPEGDEAAQWRWEQAMARDPGRAAQVERDEALARELATQEAGGAGGTDGAGGTAAGGTGHTVDPDEAAIAAALQEEVELAEAVRAAQAVQAAVGGGAQPPGGQPAAGGDSIGRIGTAGLFEDEEEAMLAGLSAEELELLGVRRAGATVEQEEEAWRRVGCRVSRSVGLLRWAGWVVSWCGLAGLSWYRLGLAG